MNTRSNSSPGKLVAFGSMSTLYSDESSKKSFKDDEARSPRSLSFNPRPPIPSNRLQPALEINNSTSPGESADSTPYSTSDDQRLTEFPIRRSVELPIRRSKSLHRSRSSSSPKSTIFPSSHSRSSSTRVVELGSRGEGGENSNSNSRERVCEEPCIIIQ